MNVSKPKNFLRSTLYVIGVLIYRLGLARVILALSKKRVRALLYHAVEEDNNPFTKGLNVGVTPSMFSANLDYFKKFYNVVPISALDPDAQSELPANPLVITFDDGYRSVYENAAPALRARQMSACVYLISRAVRGELVWVNLVNYVLNEHPERTAKVLQQFSELSTLEQHNVIAHLQNSSPPALITAVYNALMNEFADINATGLYASAEDVKTMSEQGMEFGFHTADHFNLRNCTSEELATQLDSRDVTPLLSNNTFAYPFGYYNQNAIEQLDKQNYTAVMTVGNNNRQYFHRHLDRTEVFTSDPAALFAQLEVVEPVVSWLRSKLLSSPAQTTGYQIPVG